jgi:wyosine [tRNA(Phe)-imidazoG37] synthetase (radical SAM superfamily)
MDLNRFNPYKILAHADRLRQIADGGEPYPVDWHVYPSNVCDHACHFCMFIQNGEQQNFHVKLPRDLLLRAVDDAARTGAHLMHFSGGGEPLLNRHTPEAMERARAKGLKVAISTNGAHLKPEIASLIHYIRVSLNAGTKEQHHATNHALDPRHPGDWDRILDNIAACVPAARAAGNDIGLAFVVYEHNWRDIEPFCAVAAGLGVDFVHIRPGFYYNPEADHATRAIMPDAFAACERAKASHGDKVQIFAISDKFDGYWTPRDYHRCLAVWTGTTLRATGDFAVCQDRTDLVWGRAPSYKAGATFEECWHSEERRALVASIHDGLGGELSACPRCVWNNRNRIIEGVFVKDTIRLDLI